MTALPSSRSLEERARAWARDDPDPKDRAEIESLLAAGTNEARGELEDRFSGRLHFGTAGLRGQVAAGPNRMNRAVVRATTVALAAWLARHKERELSRGVVVGCDARHRSSELADEATAVLTGAGISVHRLADQRPTPLLAFAVRHLGAVAGVMITASHNPPADNGYKLYLGDGAQIVPPVDAEIEALIDQVGKLGEVVLGDLHGPLVVHHDADVLEAYLDVVVHATPATERPERPLSVVYTPMHGVAGSVLLEAVRRAGYPPPEVVRAQFEPDPDFPTVAFPNPEEPGALDLAIARAVEVGADLVLATDPDGDRLAVAAPEPPDGAWRRLTGDEVGVLLGSFVVERTAGVDGRLVASSIVSSSMLGTIAAEAGVAFVATLTGFKWIVRAVDAVPGSRLVFGYEEALGYSVGDAVHDKDGVSAALAMLGLAGELRSQGSDLFSRLDTLALRHGLHLSAQRSVRLDGAQAASVTARLRAGPPEEIAGDRVERVVDLAPGIAWQEGLPALVPADVLAYFLASGARVIVRPSGTEPKVKCYVQVVHAVTPGDLAAARRRAQDQLALLCDATEALVRG